MLTTELQTERNPLNVAVDKILETRNRIHGKTR